MQDHLISSRVNRNNNREDHHHVISLDYACARKTSTMIRATDDIWIPTPLDYHSRLVWSGKAGRLAECCLDAAACSMATKGH